MDLSNREWASIILTVTLLLFGILNPGIRPSFVAVIKAAGNRHIVTVVSAYLLLLIWISDALVSIGFWSWDGWLNLLMWSLFAGFPIVFSVTEAGKQKGLFRNKLVDAVSLAAFVGLIAEVHSFPLWVELFLPLLTLIFWFGGYGPQQDPRTKGCFRVAMLVTTVLIIANSIWWMVANINSAWVQEQGMSILVVTAWTFATLVFLFLFSVYAVYELAFLKFKFARATPSLPLWKAKLAVVCGIGVDVELAHKFKPYWARRVLQSSSLKAALVQMEEFKYDVNERAEQQQREELKLRHNAGIEGVDERGRQLDQREFKETIEALDWLWTCHAGRYSKNNRYEEETLDIVAKGGFKGLPVEHGVRMGISDEGQSWYAYRQTVGGWYFGVGSNGPRSTPRNKWHYDGPEPPGKWLSDDQWDIVPGGTHSKHWPRGY